MELLPLSALWIPAVCADVSCSANARHGHLHQSAQNYPKEVDMKEPDAEEFLSANKVEEGILCAADAGTVALTVQ